MNINDFPSPIQVCRESNWIGFTGGFLALVWNRSGELLEPFHGVPSPEASAASNFRLVLPHVVPGRFAVAWCGGTEIYEVRSDGSLWGRTQPLSTQTATQVGQWRQLGKRSDWISLWGAGGTAVGLTADGTLWTWGIDPGGQVGSRSRDPAQGGAKPAHDRIRPGTKAHACGRNASLSEATAAVDAVGAELVPGRRPEGGDAGGR